jgi:hypothetical protein
LLLIASSTISSILLEEEEMNYLMNYSKPRCLETIVRDRNARHGEIALVFLAKMKGGEKRW